MYKHLASLFLSLYSVWFWKSWSKVTRTDVQSIFKIFISFFSALRRGSQLYHYCKTSQRPNKYHLHGQSSTSVLSTTIHTGTVWRTPFVKLTEMPAALRLEQMLWKLFEFIFLTLCLNWGMFHLFELPWMVPSLSYGVIWGSWWKCTGILIKLTSLVWKELMSGTLKRWK